MPWKKLVKLSVRWLRGYDSLYFYFSHLAIYLEDFSKSFSRCRLVFYYYWASLNSIHCCTQFIFIYLIEMTKFLCRQMRMLLLEEVMPPPWCLCLGRLRYSPRVFLSQLIFTPPSWAKWLLCYYAFYYLLLSRKDILLFQSDDYHILYMDILFSFSWYYYIRAACKVNALTF